MRIEEVLEGNAAANRAKRLKGVARAAQRQASQLKARAELDAERVDATNARRELEKRQRSAVTKNIKPYGPS